MLSRHVTRILVPAIAAFAAAFLALSGLAAFSPSTTPARVEWGVTFSQKQCAHLGVDWREAYGAMLADLRPAVVRLVAYWDVVEPRRGEYDFADLDEQVGAAEAAGASVVIAVGQKTPRWPEYHFPRWLDVSDGPERETRLLRYLETVVVRYRDRPGLRYWQVENEPFLAFGRGPRADPELLAREVALVRRLDPRHPVLVTDGGEWGWWVRAAAAGDVFGTTLYRAVYDRSIGTFAYPLPPGYYVAKTRLTRLVLGRSRERFICAELAAEPWGDEPLARMTASEQRSLFPSHSIGAVASFAARAGFGEAYFWGVEWWYRRKLDGDPSYWDAARRVMRDVEGDAVRPSEP